MRRSNLACKRARSIFAGFFKIDSAIDTTRVSAGFEQDLFTLKLPKAEAAKPRRIEINGPN